MIAGEPKGEKKSAGDTNDPEGMYDEAGSDEAVVNTD
jgi:murein L,D-transpeptidase YafK